MDGLTARCFCRGSGNIGKYNLSKPAIFNKQKTLPIVTNVFFYNVGHDSNRDRWILVVSRWWPGLRYSETPVFSDKLQRSGISEYLNPGHDAKIERHTYRSRLES